MGSPRATTSAHTLDDDDQPEYIDHLLILYASETGNSQDVAERLGREVRRRGRRCVLMSMDTFDVVCLSGMPDFENSIRMRHPVLGARAKQQFELIDVPLVVFITSTHGNGDPPPAMMSLWTALLRKGLPEDILEGNSCSPSPAPFLIGQLTYRGQFHALWPR
jgi:sulfite reductase alpha subunit-like flavoprotein